MASTTERAALAGVPPLARKKRGSHRRQKQRRRVARLHEKIANVRRSLQHQTAHDLVVAFDVICHEDLADAHQDPRS